MKLLDKDSFEMLCGKCATYTNYLTLFNGREYECVCGDTHIFDEKHTIHVCYQSACLDNRIVTFCPDNNQHFTLLKPRFNLGILPDGFIALAGYIAGTSNCSSCSSEYMDTLNAEPWIQALWEWEDINGYSFFPRNKYDLIHLKKLSLGHYEFDDMPYEDKITELPNEICNLSHLKHLILGSVTMPEVYITFLTKLPDNIGNLTLLESLYVQNNQLDSLPVTVGNLTNLKDLKLGGNKLTNLPKEIGNLTSLEILTLWDNNLTDLPSEIGNLHQLKGLDIMRNPIRRLPEEIVMLTNLKTFYLNDDMLISQSQKNWINELKRNDCEIFYPY